MKKIRVTIKREDTFDILLNDEMLDNEWLDAWENHIDGGIRTEPDEIGSLTVPMHEADYPYINLAKSIAYAIAADYDHIESLEFQNITENEFFIPQKDPSIQVHYVRIGYQDTEFEIDFDSSEL